MPEWRVLVCLYVQWLSNLCSQCMPACMQPAIPTLYKGHSVHFSSRRRRSSSVSMRSSSRLWRHAHLYIDIVLQTASSSSRPDDHHDFVSFRCLLISPWCLQLAKVGYQLTTLTPVVVYQNHLLASHQLFIRLIFSRLKPVCAFCPFRSVVFSCFSMVFRSFLDLAVWKFLVFWVSFLFWFF